MKLINILEQSISKITEAMKYDMKKYADNEWKYDKFNSRLYNEKYNAAIWPPYDVIKDEDNIYDDEHIPYFPDGGFVIQTSKWRGKDSEQRIQDEEQNLHSFKSYNAALNFIPKLKKGNWFKK